MVACPHTFSAEGAIVAWIAILGLLASRAASRAASFRAPPPSSSISPCRRPMTLSLYCVQSILHDVMKYLFLPQADDSVAGGDNSPGPGGASPTAGSDGTSTSKRKKNIRTSNQHQ